MRERCRFCKCGRAASSFGYDRRRPLKLAMKLATHRKTSSTSAPIIAKANIVPPPILTKGRAGWMPGACCLYVPYFQLDIKGTQVGRLLPVIDTCRLQATLSDKAPSRRLVKKCVSSAFGLKC